MSCSTATVVPPGYTEQATPGKGYSKGTKDACRSSLTGSRQSEFDKEELDSALAAVSSPPPTLPPISNLILSCPGKTPSASSSLSSPPSSSPPPSSSSSSSPSSAAAAAASPSSLLFPGSFGRLSDDSDPTRGKQKRSRGEKELGGEGNRTSKHSRSSGTPSVPSLLVGLSASRPLGLGSAAPLSQTPAAPSTPSVESAPAQSPGVDPSVAYADLWKQCTKGESGWVLTTEVRSTLRSLVSNLIRESEEPIDRLIQTLKELNSFIGSCPGTVLPTLQELCQNMGLLLSLNTFFLPPFASDPKVLSAVFPTVKLLVRDFAPARCLLPYTKILNVLLSFLSSVEMHKYLRCGAQLLYNLIDNSTTNKRLLIASNGLCILISLAESLFLDPPGHHIGCDTSCAQNHISLVALLVNVLWICMTEAKECSSLDPTGPMRVFTSESSISLLIRFLSSGVPELRSPAAGIIGQLSSFSSAIALQFADSQEDVFASLMNALGMCSDGPKQTSQDCPVEEISLSKDSETLQQWALYALGTLLRDCPTSVAKLLKIPKVPLTLIAFLRSGNPEIQRLSCVALHSILEHSREIASQTEIPSQIATSFFFDSLSALVRSPLSIVAQASLLLASVIPPYLLSRENVLCFQSSDLFSRLLVCATSPNPQIVGIAGQSIANLLFHSQSLCAHLAMSFPELVPTMTNLLSYPCPTLQSIGCGVLCSCAAIRFECSTAIRMHKGIEKLLSLVNSSVLRVQCRAVGAIGSCAANNGWNKKYIRDLGAISTFVGFLRSPHTELRIITTATLSNCMCDSPETQAQVLRYGGIAALVENLSSGCAELKTWTLRALFNGSKDNPQISEEIGRLGGCATLCQIALQVGGKGKINIHQTLCA